MTTEIETIKAAIAQCLDAAYCDYTLDDDGDFYIKTGVIFPVWVQVLDNGFVKIFTCARFSTEKDFNEELTNKLVNEMSKVYLPNAIFHADQKLWSTYFLPVMDGFSPRTFMNVIRTCSDSFRAACKDCDHDNLLA